MDVTASLSASVLVIISLVELVMPCSPPVGHDPYSRSPSQKSYLYDVAIMGRVLSTEEDSRFDYGAGSSAYTAHLEVYCVYKGSDVPSTIDIPEAGFIPGHCMNHELLVDHSYIILLRQTENGLRLGMTILASQENLDNFTSACGLSLQPPQGSEEHMDVCTPPAPQDQCEAEVIPPPYEGGAPPAPPPGAYDYDGDGDHDDDDHHHSTHDHDHDGDGDHDEEDHIAFGNHDDHDHDGDGRHTHSDHHHDDHDTDGDGIHTDADHHHGDDHHGEHHEGHDHEQAAGCPALSASTIAMFVAFILGVWAQLKP